uniref:C2 domain-containing protein n=1 Tax=Oryza punctata TaxID=4537 RepID=A0A0E0K6T8_ORYPU
MSAGGRHRDDCSASPSPSPPPSTLLQMLEVTVISAQDLHRRFGRRVRAYAVAWADDAHKLRTGVDLAGGADPTWNDRFLFRVDDDFLRSETAAVTVEVRAPRRFGGDAVLGVTRIVVSTFVGSSGPSSARGPTGRQVAALQLRRPRSLRPQGIVNVAVALLDASDARAVPLRSAPDSPDAFSVKDLLVKRLGSLAKIVEVSETEEADDEPAAALVEHSGPMDARGSAVEQRKLELTLEKWKADLSPEQQKANCRRSRSRRHRRRSSCFGGSAEWDR